MKTDTAWQSFRKATSLWRRKAVTLEKLVYDSEDIVELKDARDEMDRATFKIQEWYDRLVDLLTADDELCEIDRRFDEIEVDNHTLIRRVSSRIQHLTQSDNDREDREPVKSVSPMKAQPTFPPVQTADSPDNTSSPHAQAAAVCPRQQLQPVQWRTETSQMTTNAVPVETQSPSLDTLLAILTEQVTLSRLPPPEPGIFSGDPLSYPGWKSTFHLLIERRGIPADERVHYLQRYLSGEAKEAVEGFLLLSTPGAYEDAKAVLEKRYGDSFVVAGAFRDKLERWPKIPNNDGKSLRKFSDYVNQCVKAMETVPSLNVLNDERENFKLLQKMPPWLINRWGRLVAGYRAEHRMYPSLSEFSRFLEKEADLACDPVTSLQALKVEGSKNTSVVKPSYKKRTSSSFNTSATTNGEKTDSQEKVSCAHCKKKHSIDDCFSFRKLSVDDKTAFIMKCGLCFGCLAHGHRSRRCQGRLTCKTCGGNHPTSLHHGTNKALDKKPTESEHVTRSGSSFMSGTNVHDKCTMIVPVWVSHTDNPHAERLVYALLDTQSDTSFILEATRRSLNVTGTEVKLRLSTMSARDQEVDSLRVQHLMVRGFHGTTKIPLSVAYTQGTIPANRRHIPTPEIARQWPYLQRIADDLVPLQSCEVGLLIGYDCSRALVPRQVVPPRGDGPYGQRTDLGWGIIGICDTQTAQDDTIGLSHHMICRATSGHSVFVHRTQTKEILSTPLKILEQDFADIRPDDDGLSQDDRKFLDHMNRSIIQNDDGHYEMPLPLRDRCPDMPNNRQLAFHRLMKLKHKLQRDPAYRTVYSGCIEKLLKQGHAEIIPDDELEVDNGAIWYLPHHGVINPKKPGKLRVVFDASCRYRGSSLNDILLQGPDLTNSLLGVLLRFRQEQVAVMCDVQQMFHQFQVSKTHRDYLRFLWWDSDLQEEPVDYRMTVHLFGAKSSPGCANFGLKQIVADHGHEYGEGASRFVNHNFYVDDGLTSVPTEQDAMQLIADTRALCARGALKLHKYACNKKTVMEKIPKEEQSQDNRCFPQSQPIERALGVEWHVESDTFQFRVVIPDQMPTRRSVLSIVSSIYDPLGFVAPVVLIGKQILHAMSSGGVDWDSPLPDYLIPAWDRWKHDITFLEKISIPRCLTPSHFGNIVSRSLHHFSDASTSGYGQCSYLFTRHGQIPSCPLEDCHRAPIRVGSSCGISSSEFEVKEGIRIQLLRNLLDRQQSCSWLHTE